MRGGVAPALGQRGLPLHRRTECDGYLNQREMVPPWRDAGNEGKVANAAQCAAPALSGTRPLARATTEARSH